MAKVLTFLCLPLLFAASCASSGNSSGSSTPTASSSSQGANITSVDSWVAKNSKDNGFSQDADGNWVPKSNKRSSFDSQGESPYFKGDYSKKEFKTKDYAKKSWWGDTQYQTKQYEGNTDGSRFQEASAFQGQQARDVRKAADLPGEYRTNAFATGTASEAGGQRIGRPSDAETDVRRKVFQAPSVVDWREQRAMDVGQTRSILGR